MWVLEMRKLERADSDTYSYTTHNIGGANNFTLIIGRGYEIEINNSVNYTLT